MKTVAVVIPVHSPEPQHLRAALASLEAQTYTAWECVVVVDGPCDLDLSWVSQRIVRQPRAGVSAARNRGVREAGTSELIAFLDQDDLWQATYLERQVGQFRERPDIVMSSTDFEVIDAAGQRLRGGYHGFNDSYEALLCGCGVALSAVVVRRDRFEAVGGFRDFPFAQDWDLWLRLTRARGRIGRVEQPLVQWREHGANASRRYRQLWRDSKRILSEHDHPAAREGRSRMRRLSGTQAFDRARENRDPRALAWALWHAPAYTSRQLVNKALATVLNRMPRSEA